MFAGALRIRFTESPANGADGKVVRVAVLITARATLELWHLFPPYVLFVIFDN